MKETPLVQRGLTIGQKPMYLSTMWSYLSGFAAVVYLAAPMLFLFLGVYPIKAFSAQFFLHIGPYLVANQLAFIVAGWGYRVWRGHQYNLALFPLWIHATWTAVVNVVLGRPLGFVVNPKMPRDGPRAGSSGHSSSRSGCCWRPSRSGPSGWCSASSPTWWRWP
jgi:cellulose synthase (UDP-forming)